MVRGNYLEGSTWTNIVVNGASLPVKWRLQSIKPLEEGDRSIKDDDDGRWENDVADDENENIKVVYDLVVGGPVGGVRGYLSWFLVPCFLQKRNGSDWCVHALQVRATGQGRFWSLLFPNVF
jgi:hypothetical protein